MLWDVHAILAGSFFCIRHSTKKKANWKHYVLLAIPNSSKLGVGQISREGGEGGGAQQELKIFVFQGPWK